MDFTRVGEDVMSDIKVEAKMKGYTGQPFVSLFEKRIKEAGERADSLYVLRIMKGTVLIKYRIGIGRADPKWATSYVIYDDIATAEECPLQKAMDKLEAQS